MTNLGAKSSHVQFWCSVVLLKKKTVLVNTLGDEQGQKKKQSR